MRKGLILMVTILVDGGLISMDEGLILVSEGLIIVDGGLILVDEGLVNSILVNKGLIFSGWAVNIMC